MTLFVSNYSGTPISIQGTVLREALAEERLSPLWHGIPIHTHQAKRIYLTIK